MVTWHEAGKLDRLDPDEPLGTTIGGQAIGLYLVDGDVVALSDWCPHQSDVHLSDGWIEDGMIVCPMHQSQFALRGGRCMSPPADEDVTSYPVKVEDGVVWVGL